MKQIRNFNGLTLDQFNATLLENKENTESDIRVPRLKKLAIVADNFCHHLSIVDSRLSTYFDEFNQDREISKLNNQLYLAYKEYKKFRARYFWHTEELRKDCAIATFETQECHKSARLQFEYNFHQQQYPHWLWDCQHTYQLLDSNRFCLQEAIISSATVTKMKKVSFQFQKSCVKLSRLRGVIRSLSSETNKYKLLRKMFVESYSGRGLNSKASYQAMLALVIDRHGSPGKINHKIYKVRDRANRILKPYGLRVSWKGLTYGMAYHNQIGKAAIVASAISCQQFVNCLLRKTYYEHNFSYRSYKKCRDFLIQMRGLKKCLEIANDRVESQKTAKNEKMRYFSMLYHAIDTREMTNIESLRVDLEKKMIGKYRLCLEQKVKRGICYQVFREFGMRYYTKYISVKFGDHYVELNRENFRSFDFNYNVLGQTKLLRLVLAMARKVVEKQRLHNNYCVEPLRKLAIALDLDIEKIGVSLRELSAGVSSLMQSQQVEIDLLPIKDFTFTPQELHNNNDGYSLGCLDGIKKAIKDATRHIESMPQRSIQHDTEIPVREIFFWDYEKIDFEQINKFFSKMLLKSDKRKFVELTEKIREAKATIN